MYFMVLLNFSAYILIGMRISPYPRNEHTYGSEYVITSPFLFCCLHISFQRSCCSQERLHPLTLHRERLCWTKRFVRFYSSTRFSFVRFVWRYSNIRTSKSDIFWLLWAEFDVVWSRALHDPDTSYPNLPDPGLWVRLVRIGIFIRVFIFTGGGRGSGLVLWSGSGRLTNISKDFGHAERFLSVNSYSDRLLSWTLGL